MGCARGTGRLRRPVSLRGRRGTVRAVRRRRQSNRARQRVCRGQTAPSAARPLSRGSRRRRSACRGAAPATARAAGPLRPPRRRVGRPGRCSGRRRPPRPPAGPPTRLATSPVATSRSTTGGRRRRRRDDGCGASASAAPSVAGSRSASSPRPNSAWLAATACGALPAAPCTSVVSSSASARCASRACRPLGRRRLQRLDLLAAAEAEAPAGRSPTSRVVGVQPELVERVRRRQLGVEPDARRPRSCRTWCRRPW